MALFSSGTSKDRLASGTTAERENLTVSDAGSIRFNTSLGLLEQWDGTAWISVLKDGYSYPGGSSQTFQERLEQYVSVVDFGAVGDGTTDDTTSIQNALSSGAQCVVFPQSSADYYVTNRLKIPNGVDVDYQSTNFIRINPTADSGEVVGCMGNNIIRNIRIDAASGDNLNAIGANGGAGTVSGIEIIGGFFKNAIRTTQGGRAITFQLGVQDCAASNFIAENCTAAVDVHGYSDNNKTIQNVVFSSFIARDCDEVGSSYGLFSSGPEYPEENSCIISNFAAYNCGDGGSTGGGVFCSHRGAYMKISNGIIVNDSSYGSVGGLFHGLGYGNTIENVKFYGDVTTLFNHTHPANSQGAENPNAKLSGFKANNIYHEGNISANVVDINLTANDLKNSQYFNISVASLPTTVFSAAIANSDNIFMLVDRTTQQTFTGQFKYFAYGDALTDFPTHTFTGPTRVGPLTSWLSGGNASIGTTSGQTNDVSFRREGLSYASLDGTENVFRVESSDWDGRHLCLGSHHIWVDTSDRLRIKLGVPTSETDGTIVGTQS